jgi:hypothetical protein
MVTIYIDLILRIIFATGLFVWNVIEGAAFENYYPKALVTLYTVPLWRFTLLVATILGTRWSTSVGIMMAFAVFFYVMDMEVTLNKWA